jgi:hypothetical protein
MRKFSLFTKPFMLCSFVALQMPADSNQLIPTLPGVSASSQFPMMVGSFLVLTLALLILDRFQPADSNQLIPTLPGVSASSPSQYVYDETQLHDDEMMIMQVSKRKNYDVAFKLDAVA